MTSRVYLDSCVFLSYLMAVPGRIGTLEAVFAEAADPKSPLTLYTSTLAIAEVAYIVDEHGKADLSSDAFEKIDEMWDDRRINIVEAHRGTGEHARDIIRNRALSLTTTDQKPVPRNRSADLIHLGTARSLGIREVWTYDGPLKKFVGVIPGMDILEPHTGIPRLAGFDELMEQSHP